MIPAAGIEYQELAIAAKGTGLHYPAVAGGGNLGAAVAGDGNPLLGSTDAVGVAEVTDFGAVNRQMQVAAHGRERNRGRQPAGILQGGEIGACRILLYSVRLQARFAGGGIEALLELGDQIL